MLNTNRGIKTILYLKCVLYRTTHADTITREFAYHSSIKLILENTDVSEVYDEMTEEIEASIQKVEEPEGSGWVFLRIINLTLHTAKWDPLNAGSYIDLPPFLKKRKLLLI